MKFKRNSVSRLRLCGRSYRADWSALLRKSQMVPGVTPFGGQLNWT
jgi:hypothetical protein